MTGASHISPEDLALHAMQTLSAEESAAVGMHLADCALCREELAKLQGDLALVAFSVEQHPVPEGARQRFMAKISASSADAQKPSAPRFTESAVVSIDRRPARSLRVWVPWAAVAALLIIAVVLRVQVEQLNARLHDMSREQARLAEANARAQEIAEVLTAPSAQHVVLTAAKSPVLPTGRAIYLAKRGALIFQASNLARLAEDKTYELWVIPASGAAPVPAGLFRPDEAGNASVVLPPIPKGVAAKAFGVTIEKASGSDTPTLPIILAGAAVSAPGE